MKSLQSRTVKSGRPVEETGEINNFGASDEEPGSPRLGNMLKVKKKKKELITKRIVPKPQIRNLIQTNSKPIEFHEKAIVIYLKSVCREQQEKLENQSKLF